MADQSELVRIALVGQGRLAVGRSLPGRGAWLCRDSPRCFDLAARKRRFAQALRSPVAREALEALAGELYGDRPGAG